MDLKKKIKVKIVSLQGPCSLYRKLSFPGYYSGCGHFQLSFSVYCRGHGQNPLSIFCFFAGYMVRIHWQFSDYCRGHCQNPLAIFFLLQGTWSESTGHFLFMAGDINPIGRGGDFFSYSYYHVECILFSPTCIN